jgi:Phage integrase, N-terminal SAM-like domain
MSALAPTLQAFFTDRLIRQRHASVHTVAAYRDTMRLLLGYAATRTGLPPSQLDLADLDAPLIAKFLDHLERERGNSVRTRNARLAAIHSLFRFAALDHPEHAESNARVPAIPPKRFDRALISYLTEPEVDALLGCCDPATWTGRRDHALLLLAVQTGLRISELTGSPAPMSTSARARTSPATARAERTGSPRSPAPRSTSCASGSANTTTTPARRCSRPVAAARSAATRSSIDSPTTRSKPPAAVRRCTARESPRTSCGTPPRCGCCTPASTPASSPSGSVTSASRPPRSTCTPISN